MNEVEILTVNPLDSETAWLVPQLASRVMLFAHRVARDPDSELFARRFMARLVLADPNFRAVVGVAVVSGESIIVAHTIGEVAQVDGENTLFILQVEVDPGFSAVVDKFHSEADNWAKSMKITTIRTEIVPTNNDKAWLRLYQRRGWKLVSTVMERSIG